MARRSGVVALVITASVIGACSRAPAADDIAQPVLAEVAPAAHAEVPVEAAEPAEPEPPPEPAAPVGPKAQNMGWVVLAPEGGGFQLELPSTPRHEQRAVQGKNGLTSTIQQWQVSDDVAGTFYVVAVSPLVQQLVEFGDSELALDRTLEAATRNGMRVDKTSKIVFEGFSGRQADIVITAPDGEAGELHGRIRLYLVGVRLYQLIGVWSDERGQTQVEKFFMSLGFDEDVATLETQPVDLWRRFAAPGDVLDIALPGPPDRTTLLRDTPFGRRQVESVSLLSPFPPAIYGMQALPLAGLDREAAPGSLYDRWEATLDAPLTAKKKNKKKAEVLGQPARMVEGEGVTWLAFVHDGTLYEMYYQPIVKPGEEARATDRERDRFFASPAIARTPAPPATTP